MWFSKIRFGPSRVLHIILGFCISTVYHIVMRVAKMVANWKSWQPWVLRWFGQTVAQMVFFLAPDSWSPPGYLWYLWGALAWVAHFLDLISLSNSSFPEIHYCVCVGGGCSQLYYSLLWKWSTESKETSRFTLHVCFPLSSSDSYVQSCTLWGSFSRGLSMSRTMGLKVDSNIFYKISGHALLVGKWWTCLILAFLIRTNSFSRGIFPKFEFPIYKNFTLWSLEIGHSLKFWI